MDEKEIRKSLIKRREELSAFAVQSASKKVENTLFALQGVLDYDTYFVYKSFRGEIDTKRIIKRLKSAGKRVLFPLVQGGEMLAVESKTGEFVQDKFGVEVPKDYEVFVGMPSCIITPLVACDKNLNRMGFGRGYYDRFFAKAPCLKIGLCHDFQVLDALSPKEWDIPLDIIVTEKRVLLPTM